jgi:hypothetical protein
VVTVIDEVVAPVFHINAPEAGVDNTELPQPFTTLTTGIETLITVIESGFDKAVGEVRQEAVDVIRQVMMSPFIRFEVVKTGPVATLEPFTFH